MIIKKPKKFSGLRERVIREATSPPLPNLHPGENEEKTLPGIKPGGAYVPT